MQCGQGGPRVRARGETSALSVAFAPVRAAQDAAGLCCQGTATAHITSLPTEHPTFFFTELLPSLSSSKGFFILRCGVWHLSMLELVEFLLAQSCLGPVEMSSWSLNMVVLQRSISVVLPSSFKEKTEERCFQQRKITHGEQRL